MKVLFVLKSFEEKERLARMINLSIQVNSKRVEGLILMCTTDIFSSCCNKYVFLCFCVDCASYCEIYSEERMEIIGIRDDELVTSVQSANFTFKILRVTIHVQSR